MRRFRFFALLSSLAVSLSALSLSLNAQVTALTVNATGTQQKLLRVHEVIPVSAGKLTLYYPKWIPGNHRASGPISSLTGLKFTAGGKNIPWLRDTLDVYTFHLDIPAGVKSLDTDFDILEPPNNSATDKLMVLAWNSVVLYPAGTPAQKQMFEAKLQLPEGWKFGTSLPVSAENGNQVAFKPISLDMLVDSPVIAGQYYRAIDITPPGEPIHHELDMVADSEAALNLSADNQKQMMNLVVESGKLFGSRHYRDYHFLLTLSDHVAHFGLEHHESNDSRLPERALLLPTSGKSVGGLLAHEFVHSWNGKFRRPADLTVPYFEQPMETDLLWGYEGLTDYLGPLLAARSGLWTKDQYLDQLASIAGALGPGRTGRTWRPLIDTAIGEPGMPGRGAWYMWRRGTDYYDEGDLLWLEAASIIHRESKGEKSIDDFCQSFFGGANNGPEVKTYTSDQLMSALNAIAPYDWAGFFKTRLESTSAEAPVGGIENGGWKVVMNEKPPRSPGRPGGPDYTYSLGMQVGADGSIADTVVGGPAFKAGIGPGMKVIGVNSRVYTADVLADAVKAAKDGTKPITLQVVSDDYIHTFNVDYHGGPQYPHLVRVEDKPDYLDELIKPRVTAK
jgi:predicted metalloprotease with PDZ domain